MGGGRRVGWDEFLSFSFRSLTIRSVAALLHDVCDHKYISKGDHSIAQEDFLSSTYTPYEADFIKLVIDSVSYSKENKGKLETTFASMTPLQRFVRDVVSDADKIEALGEIGLERCFQYAKENGSTDEEAWLHVAEHCDEKLLLLLPHFIHTR